MVDNSKGDEAAAIIRTEMFTEEQLKNDIQYYL